MSAKLPLRDMRIKGNAKFEIRIVWMVSALSAIESWIGLTLIDRPG
jgi:hypothetical protein